MADKLHYTNPPLLEAVAAVIFERDGWDWTHPGLFHPHLKEAYPVVEQNLIAFPALLPNQQNQFPQNMSFLSTDKRSLIRLDPNHLSVHELAPYQGWAAFSARFSAAIKTYADIAPERMCQAISIRFINVINLPEDDDSPIFGEDILLPFSPPESHGDRALVGFHANFMIHGHEVDTYIRTNFAYNNNQIAIHNQPIDHTKCLLDISIGWSPTSDGMIPLARLVEDDLVARFDSLHNELKQYFIDCFSKRVHEEWFGWTQKEGI